MRHCGPRKLDHRCCDAGGPARGLRWQASEAPFGVVQGPGRPGVSQGRPRHQRAGRTHRRPLDADPRLQEAASPERRLRLFSTAPPLRNRRSPRSSDSTGTADHESHFRENTSAAIRACMRGLGGAIRKGRPLWESPLAIRAVSTRPFHLRNRRRCRRTEGIDARASGRVESMAGQSLRAGSGPLRTVGIFTRMTNDVLLANAVVQFGRQRPMLARAHRGPPGEEPQP